MAWQLVTGCHACCTLQPCTRGETTRFVRISQTFLWRAHDHIGAAIKVLALFLRLLPRSATGQRITSYNTFVGGPRAPSDEDGPEEFQLVLVDNGRTNLLRDEVMRETLRCIRCGAP